VSASDQSLTMKLIRIHAPSCMISIRRVQERALADHGVIVTKRGTIHMDIVRGWAARINTHVPFLAEEELLMDASDAT
jgi:hypothetical protein